MDELLFFIAKEIKGAATEFQLLPYGQIEIEGEPPAFVDEESAPSIIADFERRGNDMVIDYEHQTLKDVQAPAAGWIKKLINQGKEGVWATVEWTEKAKEYLQNKEYRYFSPVFWVANKGRKVVRIDNVALTNFPKINNLKPIVAKKSLEAARAAQEEEKKLNNKTFRKEAKIMWEKLRKLFGLAEDAGEDQVVEAATAIVAKNKELEKGTDVVACKEIMDALELDEGADQTVVIAKIEAIKAPGSAAEDLSKQVASLTQTINAMKRDDLVALALKDGKTSPDEVEKWGKDLAEKNPEEFTKIVLSRAKGSVIPIKTLPNEDP